MFIFLKETEHFFLLYRGHKNFSPFKVVTSIGVPLFSAFLYSCNAFGKLFQRYEIPVHFYVSLLSPVKRKTCWVNVRFDHKKYKNVSRGELSWVSPNIFNEITICFRGKLCKFGIIMLDVLTDFQYFYY